VKRACPLPHALVLFLAVVTGCRENRTPTAIAEVTGPVTGIVDSTYTYTTSITDRDGDAVSYRFAWGDGDTSDWTELVPCDSPFYHMSHAWRTIDSFSVQAQVRDQHGATAEWSSPHVVTIGGPFTLRLADSIPVQAPIMLALAPQDDYMYASACCGMLYRVRLRDKQVDTLIPDWPPIYAVVLHPDGQRLYFAGNDRIGVMSVPEGALDTVLSIRGYCSCYAVMLPSGDQIYFTMTSSRSDTGKVVVLRTSDNRVVAELGGRNGCSRVAASPTGDNVYVTNLYDSSISVIRTSDNQEVAVVTLGACPYGIAAAPDGQSVYVACDDGNMRILDAARNAVVGSVPIGMLPTDLAVTPDGKYMFRIGYGRLNVAHLPDNEVVDSLGFSGNSGMMVFASSRNRVFIPNTYYRGIRIVDY